MLSIQGEGLCGSYSIVICGMNELNKLKAVTTQWDFYLNISGAQSCYSMSSMHFCCTTNNACVPEDYVKELYKNITETLRNLWFKTSKYSGWSYEGIFPILF